MKACICWVGSNGAKVCEVHGAAGGQLATLLANQALNADHHGDAHVIAAWGAR